jgi:oxygen-dependent protoporphyrinogen oxidase
VTPDVVIIGAGISGLAAAWELRKRGLRPLIIEQTGRAGGVIDTERVDGFVIDGGPDSLLVQKPAAVELCGELGLRDRLFPTKPPRTAFVLRNGKLLQLPEASFLGIPTRMGPFVSTRLFSVAGKLRMATELVRPRGQESDESIGQFIGRRFGREAVDYLAEPLLAGIHAGDVDQLSMHSLFPRLVALEQAHGSVLRGLATMGSHGRPQPGPSAGGKTASANGAFVSLPGGVADLPEALATALGPDTFRFNTRVIQISGPAPYKVTLDTDAALHAPVVIVATPAWAAAPMFASLDAALSRLCGDIPYASSATVAFGLRRDQIAHPMNGSGFVVPRRERRALMAGTWVTSKWPHRAPENYALLRGFLGGATEPTVLDRSDETLANDAFGELRSVLGITGEPSLVRVFRWYRATPQYVVGHGERVRRIEQRLAALPGVFVTGSGYRGTGIPDCVADARTTAAAAAASLGAVAHTP